MDIQYRFRQVINLFRKLKENHKPLKWVFIYGLPRSGTTFMLQQFMKISKTGIGDWEIKEFAKVITHAKERDWVSIDTDRLINDLRKNVLAMAHIGGGNTFDITVKQISTNSDELDFYKKMFHSEPSYRIFMFREPNGFLPSAIEKFNLNEEDAIAMYKNALASYDDIGGDIIEYGEGLMDFIRKTDEFEKVRLDVFKPKRVNSPPAPETLQKLYSDFCNTHSIH